MGLKWVRYNRARYRRWLLYINDIFLFLIKTIKDVAPLENGLFNFPESLYERSTTCAYAKSKIKWEAPGEISEISPSSLTTPPKF